MCSFLTVKGYPYMPQNPKISHSQIHFLYKDKNIGFFKDYFNRRNFQLKY